MIRQNSRPTIYWTINEAGENISSLSESQVKVLLSQNEVVRYENLKIPKRKQEWLIGRLTAKALLSTYDRSQPNMPFNRISIENLPEGAPYIASHPKTGNISISHRDNIAVCAFIPDTTVIVGIDLEFIEPRQFSFVEDFFTRQETAFVNRLDENIKDLYITLIWSSKEAILKVWRKGLRLDTRKIQIHPEYSSHQSEDYSGWKSLEWDTGLDDYPNCWLGWQQWGNYVVTLAVSQPKESLPSESPIILQINTQDILATRLGV